MWLPKMRSREPCCGPEFQMPTAYIAPAGHHLLIENGMIRLGYGPRENMARPAVDPLLRSAAVSYGPRVIATRTPAGARSRASACVQPSTASFLEFNDRV